MIESIRKTILPYFGANQPVTCQGCVIIKFGIRMTTNNCYKCDRECVFKEDKEKNLFGFPCDMCCRVVCEKCNKMMAGEVRVIPRSSRSLVHLCSECIIDFKQLPKLLKQIPNMSQDIKDLKSKLEKLDQKNTLQDINKKFNGLEEQVNLVNEAVRDIKSKCINHCDPQMENDDVNLKRKEISAVLDEKINFQSEMIYKKMDSVVEAIKSTNKELVGIILDSNSHSDAATRSKQQGNSTNDNTALPNVQAIQADVLASLKGDTSKPYSISEVGKRPGKKSSSGSLMEAQLNKMNEFINLDKDPNNQNKNELKSGQNILKSSKAIIRGTNTEKLTITAAEQKKWFYVGNLNKETNMEGLKKHLELFNVSVIECKKLSRNSTYSTSFKVAVRPMDAQAILSDKIWPESVVVKPFIFNRKSHNFNNGYRREYKGNFRHRREMNYRQ